MEVSGGILRGKFEREKLFSINGQRDRTISLHIMNIFLYIEKAVSLRVLFTAGRLSRNTTRTKSTVEILIEMALNHLA